MLRAPVGSPAQTSGDTHDVSVNRESRDAKGIAQNDVGCFSPDTGKCDQLIHHWRNFAVKFRGESAAKTYQMTRLRAEETE